MGALPAVFRGIRRALVAVAVFTLVWTLAMAARGGLSAQAVEDALVTAALNFSLALVIGLFVHAILEESDRRAELIAVLERTREELAAAQRREGMLEERERLSREIHDTRTQGFTSVLMLSQAARRTVGSDPAATADRLGLVERTARDNLAEARALVAALAPADLQDGATLGEAVSRILDRFAEELDVRASFDVAGPARTLPANSEVVLLRATQEALANVRKHAGARTVGVRLRYDDGGAGLDVVDDGRGFDPEDLAGFGLPGMRARVEQVGGHLEIDSRPGLGTAVRILLPDGADLPVRERRPE